MVTIKEHLIGLKKSFQKMYSNNFARINLNENTVVRFIPTSDKDVFAVHLHFYVSTEENYDNEQR